MWIPQSIWLAGFVLFALVACWASVHALRLLVRGEHARINDDFGPQTLDEEIEAETELKMHQDAGADDVDAAGRPAHVETRNVGAQA
jgi:hypothetical protein